jgi:alanyl-tRNA synthetase
MDDRPREMAPTKRLYQADAYATQFEAVVTAAHPHQAGYAVVLDQTLFYPETGGQPCDTGSIEGARIQRVVEHGETILHLVAGEPGFKAGDLARGAIDWPRRFINMQQHTGQHILSQAFLRVLDAPTASSRLGTEHSTIDVARLNLTWDDLERAEQMANSVVFEDRPVVIRAGETAEAGDLRGDLRAKKALPDGLLRLVDVEGFDVVPCGGTHCRKTGEVGLIKVLNWEKVRESTRVEFVCGWLAQADYFWKSRSLVELAKTFTTAVDKVPDVVRETSQAAQALRRDLSRVRTRLAEYELAELEARAQTVSGVKIVAAALDGVEPGVLREMAARLAKKPGMVALVASRGERAHFVFARSADVAADMRKALGVALALVEGKGGGRAEAAEGGGKNADRVDEALAAAVSEVSGSI